MKIFKYFFEFIFIIILFIIFKILGYKLSSSFGSFVVSFIGPYFRSNNKILGNIKKALPNVSEKNLQLLINRMWKNYGRILSEYIFLKNFRDIKYEKFLIVEGKEILEKIKKSKKPVVFISGHFNNFELMPWLTL